MEKSFGGRLKRYRQTKNLTQQELADLVGVSNKTVSRWESDGGYPDVPLLVPLARALGVGTDDLLDGEKPVRTLTQADGQSLLSFAFAVGGGILFYLLQLFVPLPVCYAAYLGCLAYGVYLQRYYCYRTRWFWAGCGGMNLCVNLSIMQSLLALPLVLSLGGTFYAEDWRLWLTGRMALLTALGLIAAAVFTAVTLWLARNWKSGENRSLGQQLRAYHCPKLRLSRPPLPALLPAVGALLLTGFWGLYRMQPLSPELYQAQYPLYWALLLVLLVLCALPSLGRGRRLGLVCAGLMAAGGLILPRLTASFAWSPISDQIIEATPQLAAVYLRFEGLSPALVAAGAALCALCALTACLRMEKCKEAE